MKIRHLVYFTISLALWVAISIALHNWLLFLIVIWAAILFSIMPIMRAKLEYVRPIGLGAFLGLSVGLLYLLTGTHEFYG